ncbi:unnamed protein product, partial [marine sediment metagenome]
AGLFGTDVVLAFAGEVCEGPLSDAGATEAIAILLSTGCLSADAVGVILGTSACFACS